MLDSQISQKALKDALKQAVPTVREGRPTAKGPRSWEGVQWNGHAPPPPP